MFCPDNIESVGKAADDFGKKTYDFRTRGGRAVLEHFARDEPQCQLAHKFKDLLRKAEGAGDLFCGAYPALRNEYAVGQYDDCLFAWKSPCVYALLFRKCGQAKYEVVTFEFAAQASKQGLSDRYEGALAFFKQMKQKN